MHSRLVAAVAAGLLYFPALAQVQDHDARQTRGGIPLPPGAEPYGQSWGEWSADWWKWVVRAPSPVNPVLDTTGANCAVGQRGQVWFLAGSFGSDPVDRHCAIPVGRALFFPVVNSAYFGFPTDPPVTIDEIKALLSPIEQATGLEVRVDGIPVPGLSRHLVTSEVFSVVAPADNIFSAFGVTEGTLLSPCLDEGFYVMLTPLAPGDHTIVIRATAFFGTQDVTYHLDVRGEH
jgi:hypothetical protein